MLLGKLLPNLLAQHFEIGEVYPKRREVGFPLKCFLHGLQCCPNSYGLDRVRKGSNVRLAKKDIRQQRAALEQWQKPSEMLRRARALMHLLGNADLFNQAGVDFITEA